MNNALSCKVCIVIVMLVFVLPLISACGRNRNGDDTRYVEMPGSDIPPPPPPSPQYEDDDEETDVINAAARYIHAYGIIHQPVDLGGRVIRVLHTGRGITFSGRGEEPDPATSENYLIDRMIWDNAQRVKHTFNFQLEDVLRPHTPGDVWPYLRRSVLAGEPLGDIAWTHSHNKFPAIRENIIIPLDSLDLPNSDILGPQIFGHTESEVFGERWSFEPSIPKSGLLLGVNLSVINAIGAPNPVDLYNRGQWTWDAWLEIMRLATQDTTGNGVIDQFGISAGALGFFQTLIGSNDGSIVSGDFSCNLSHPNTVEALQFAEIIMNEGLWENSPPVNGRMHLNWTNRLRFRERNSAFFIIHQGIISDGEIPFEFTTVPFPYGPSNTSGNIIMDGWGNGFVFPQGSNWDQAEILMVVEEFWAWPGSETELLAELELPWLRDALPTEEDVQRLLRSGRNSNFCFSFMVFDLIHVLANFTDYFLTQEMTALQAIDVHSGSQQEILDNFFR